MNIDMRLMPREQQVVLYASALCITRLSDLKGQSDRASMLIKQSLRRYQRLRSQMDRLPNASREFALTQLDNEGDTVRHHKSRFKSLQLESEHHDRRLSLSVRELSEKFRVFEAPFYLNTRAQLQGAYQIVLGHGSMLQAESETFLERMDIKQHEISRRVSRTNNFGF